jgi:hypothetical protein
MIRVISLVVAGFLFLSTLEAFAGFWLAGRWFISSRYASLTLGLVKNWLDRGLINSATQTAKVFIQRNGKWIILTLGLSQVIPEVQQRIQASRYCYDPTPISDQLYMVYLYVGSYTNSVYYSHPYHPYTLFYSLSGSCPTTSRNGSNPLYLTTYRIFRKETNGWVPYAAVGQAGTYTIITRDGITCTANFSWSMSLQPCGSVDAWQNERRRVPVRVFPNPADFVHPDVIASDPALSWLRDEYQRIAQDTSIPTIPSDALDGVELPSVDWSIPPEEALDQASESSGSEGESQEGDISIPGLNTDLNIPAKRSFPVELINSIVQSHPLLRVLQGVSLDVGGGGSCVIGSRPFEFDFCPFQWVLNLMGAVIVFVSFLTGLFWAGRSD